MRTSLRLATLAAAASLLAACAGGLPPGGVAALEGVYEGEMSRSGGQAQRCPARYLWRITVTRGEARGEVFDPQQPDVPMDRFMAFIEADGRLVTAMRLGAQSFGVLGRFGANALVATAEGSGCAMSAYAARRP
jgi:hypothetical protein